ncbi:MAG: S8 family serine peptidase [Bacteroidales bacterium]|nr:S8 family serine peptidase [Bacteroidales bacterium]
MKKVILIIIISLFAGSLFAQLAPNIYWIEFKNKNGTPYSIDNPEEFLSPRAIERRNKQNIEIDTNDLPVTPQYISQIESFGLEVINVSKWLNGVVVRTNDQSKIKEIESLDFVKSVNLQGDKKKKKKEKKYKKETPSSKTKPLKHEKKGDNLLAYGLGKEQIYMHNGQELHNLGYQGENMLIAVTDAGFNNFNELRAFDSLRVNNQIIATKNIVNHTQDVFQYSTHGSNVTSVIGANIPDTLVGTAPKANFILICTEDVSYENIIEEINWACGAEFADSLGADIINVSLGYFKFDIPYWSHEESDRDGLTAWISKACNTAFSKGILVVVSAGNSGNSDNPHVGMPADAYGALTVGSIDYNSEIASTSSIGPTSDGRIKPDVCAIGAGTICQQSSGVISSSSGTSFSAPIISGLAACLWQAHPNFTNLQIMQAIKKSAHQYNSPDNIYGYGIPDFALAHEILSNIDEIENENQHKLKVYPNPFNQSVIVEYKDIENEQISIIISNIQGEEIFNKSYELSSTNKGQIKINELRDLSLGYYVLSLKDGKKLYNQKLIKLN